MLFSFVIPSYNAARYLEDCLNSIYSLDLGKNQREVIVVNDGSTDETESLTEAYKARHQELIVITQQQNRGLSAARNVGLSKAAGDYVYFVDADDILLKGADLTRVMDYASQGIDIISVDIVQRDMDGIRRMYKRYDYEYDRIYRPASTFMNNRNLMPCVVAYWYRREFLTQGSLWFTEGIFHEDEDFTPRAFARARDFVAVRVSLYERILRHGSITTTTDEGKQQQKLRNMVSVIEKLDSMQIPEMKCKLEYLTVDVLILLIRQRHPRQVRRDIIASLRKKGYFPLHWRWEPKYVVFNMITRILFQLTD